MPGALKVKVGGVWVPTAGILPNHDHNSQHIPLTDGVATRTLFAAPRERTVVSGSGMGATVTFDARTAGLLYLTSAATANSTLNIRGDASNTLNSMLPSTGDSISVTLLATNTATAYRVATVQIDGVTVTPKWSGGSAPSAGSPNAIDAYQFTIIKTAATPTYLVLGARGVYA